MNSKDLKKKMLAIKVIVEKPPKKDKYWAVRGTIFKPGQGKSK